MTQIPKSLCEGRYTVKAELGRSQFATVFECYDRKERERVAVKVLQLDGRDREIAREMYRREIGALEGVANAHTVSMLRFEEELDEDRLCIVLELIDGGLTVASLLEDHHDDEPLLRVRIQNLLGILGALDAAHSRGILHRDIKPSNILFDSLDLVWKLSDFGIAKLLQNFGRGTSGVTLREFHTRPFAAPEQLLGRATSFSTDLYAFGFVIAGVLAWRPLPAEIRTADVATFIAESPAANDSPEFRNLVSVVVRLLSDEATERPKSSAIRIALEGVLESLVEPELAPVVLTSSAKKKAAQHCSTLREALADLNTSPRILWEAEEDGNNSILWFGTNLRARLKVRDGFPQELVMVDLVKPYWRNNEHDRANATPAPFRIGEGSGDPRAVVDFAFNDFQEREAASRATAPVLEFLSVAECVVQLQRERLGLVRIQYRVLTEDDEEPQRELAPWQQKLQANKSKYLSDATLSAAPPKAKNPAKMRVKRSKGQLLEVEVESVLVGQKRHVATERLDDGCVPPNWDETLDRNTGFALEGGRSAKPFAKLFAFNQDDQILTLKFLRKTTLPFAGVISFEDDPARVSLDRQVGAMDTFKKNAAVHPQLTELILAPSTNEIAVGPVVELLQTELEPADAVADVVRRAIDAHSFFAIQGPPGTGKTTIITEVMAQILTRNPGARILLTSQANEAVQNALEALAQLRDTKNQPWRIVREVSRDKTPQPRHAFEDEFRKFADETIRRSRDAERRLSSRENNWDPKALAEVLKDWRQRIRTIGDVQKDFAESVHVWGATLMRSPSLSRLVSDSTFDYVIVDEAARATLSELLVALTRGRRFVLVGDHRQLPPFLDSDDEQSLDEAGIDVEQAKRSVFENLFERLPKSNKAVLTRQFRMHRSIGSLVGDLFYDDVGGLKTGIPDSEREMLIPSFNNDNRVFCLDVDGTMRKKADSTSSWNPAEVEATCDLLLSMNRELAAANGRYTVAVIAPYLDQVEELRKRINGRHKMWSHLKIRVATVDAFQGKQDDIVVYSAVATRTGSLKFISDPHRLNVALSRAKRLLVLVGKHDILLEDERFEEILARVPEENMLRPGRD